MLVNLEKDDILELFRNRVEYWTNDSETIELFSRMYENYIDGGVFLSDKENSVMAIVDNDYVNYCQVLEEGDDEYNLVKKLYDKNGICDISCESTRYSFIESEYNGCFLVRY